jgi:ATP-binding cassette subfamily C (CFTR/MRP) protein 2
MKNKKKKKNLIDN